MGEIDELIIQSAMRQLDHGAHSLGALHPYADYRKLRGRFIIAPAQCSVCLHPFGDIATYSWPSEAEEPHVCIMMMLAAGLPTLPDQPDYLRHECCRLTIFSAPEQPGMISFKCPVYHFKSAPADMDPIAFHKSIVERYDIYPKEIYSASDSTTLRQYAQMLGVPYLPNQTPDARIFEIYEFE